MGLSRAKPTKTARSIILDQSKTSFLLFCDLDYTLDSAVPLSAAGYQALIDADTFQVLEVYDVVPANAETGTLEIGGRLFFTMDGEKRLTANVMTTFNNTLSGFDYYTGKGVFLVTVDDNIRGIPDGTDITPYPLGQVWGGDKNPANDGATATSPQITITIDGKKAKNAEEFCLGFEFDTLNLNS